MEPQAPMIQQYESNLFGRKKSYSTLLSLFLGIFIGATSMYILMQPNLLEKFGIMMPQSKSEKNQNQIKQKAIESATTPAQNQVQPTTQISELVGWKTIFFKTLNFKVPPDWGYDPCGAIDPSYEGDMKQSDCNYEADGIIRFALLESNATIPNVGTTHSPNESNPDEDLGSIVSNSETIPPKDESLKITLQKEQVLGGQGAGTYLRAYIQDSTSHGLYQFTLSDLTYEQIFRKILTTIFINYED